MAATVLAAAAAFGSIWMVRSGVLLAVVGGFLALRYSFRGLCEQRRAAGERLIQQSRAHGRQLREERRHNSEVLETLSARIEATNSLLSSARAQVAEQTAQIGSLRGQLSTLRGDSAALRIELKRRDDAIHALRDTIAELEAGLAELRCDDDADVTEAGEVFSMPRHAAAKMPSEWDALPTADDLWTDGNHPTVADLAFLDADQITGAGLHPATELKHA